MRKILLAIIAVFSSIQLHAQALWPGPSGGGMLSVPEATVLEPGHGSIGFVMDNYDRDPLGLDIFDARVDWRLGIVHRLEFFGRYQISRALCVPGAVPVPSSPLDIFVTGQAMAPHPPYRAIYWPMPYISHHSASLLDMTPGEFTFGVKTLVHHQHGKVPEMAASLSVTVPGDMSMYALGRGSGSGSVDVTGSGIATWKINSRVKVSGNLGLTRNGPLKFSDRIVTQSSLNDDVITRPMFLSAGIGARVRLAKWASISSEYSGWSPISHATSQFDEAGASDFIAGLELRYRAFGFVAGFRQHLFPPRNLMTLPTGPLAGALDLSSLSPQAQQDYLHSIGMDPSAHRPGANLVVLGNSNVPDPAGSHRVDPTYKTHTTGNDGTVFALSLSF